MSLSSRLDRIEQVEIEHEVDLMAEFLAEKRGRPVLQVRRQLEEILARGPDHSQENIERARQVGREFEEWRAAKGR